MAAEHGRKHCSVTEGTEVTEMSTTWELMKACLADAAKAEQLVRDLAFRKELKVDRETALAAFVLWRQPAPAAAQRRVSIVSGRRLRSQRAA